MLSPTALCPENPAKNSTKNPNAPPYNDTTAEIATHSSVTGNWRVVETTASPSQLPLQPKAPPMVGFVPREDTIRLREDIRRLQLTNTAGENCTSDESASHHYDGDCQNIIAGDASQFLGNGTLTNHENDVRENLRPITTSSSHNTMSCNVADITTTHRIVTDSQLLGKGTVTIPGNDGTLTLHSYAADMHTIVTESRQVTNGAMRHFPTPAARNHTTNCYPSNHAQSTYVQRQAPLTAAAQHKARENGLCYSAFASNTDTGYSSTAMLSDTSSRSCSVGSYSTDVQFDSLRSEADLTCF